MIRLAIVLAFFLSDCRDAYLDRVLNSKGMDGYFVIFKGRVEGKEYELIASSHRLYEGLLSRKEISDLPEYVRFMKEKLAGNEPLSFSVKELLRMDAGTVEDDPEVMALAAKSPDSVLDRYFYVSRSANYARLHDNVPVEKNGAILKVLFQKNYLLRRTEGKYSVDELNFCSLIAK